MRYAENHKSKTRSRILERATLHLRRRGSSSIAVADLMKDAGLTHGGFYAHFKSRDALIDETFRQAMDGIAKRWRARADIAPEGKKLEAIVDGYLSVEHRDDVDGGCVFPAIGSEIARAKTKTRKTFTAKFRDMIDLVAYHQSGKLTKQSRQEAVGTIATMFGGLLIARAVDDDQLSDDILKAGRRLALSGRVGKKTGRR